MARVIIGIHGLGNKPPRHVLESWWKQSIIEGFKREKLETEPFEFKLVYWADILHPVPQDPMITDGDSPLYLSDPYVPAQSPAEKQDHRLRKKVLQFLEHKLNDIILDENYHINYRSVTDSLIHKYFEDLDAYYNLSHENHSHQSWNSRVAIRERLVRVLKKHQRDKIMLIGHSMGSIIAFDVLDIYQDLKIDTFVTIGSPLGLPVVIGRIASERSNSAANDKKLKTPNSIRSAWYNLADLEDKVAFDFTLADDYVPNIFGIKPNDKQVVNDFSYRRIRNPHKAYGYLRTPELSSIVHRFVSVKESNRWERFTDSLQKGFLFTKKARSLLREHATPRREPMPEHVADAYKMENRLRTPLKLTRQNMIETIRDSSKEWDFIVIGGGATGMGTALDAAARGYKTLLLEQHDFGKGTSSRSTKLVHGGVRYLQQGNVSLVLEALRERAIMLKNAPHLVHDQPFIVPAYDWWEGPFYGIGLRLYDMLAGKHGFGPSINLSTEKTVEEIPAIETEGLKGGILYHDGQFDDARLVINLAQTAADEGAALLNYAKVTSLHQEKGLVKGVQAVDQFSGEEYNLRAKCVINATGVFTDEIRRMDDKDCIPVMQASRGVHIVLDRSFLGGDSAIMIPHTDDGRVLFAIPWHGRVVVGTTDEAVESPDLEPIPSSEEVDFLLKHAARYLTRDPSHEDVLSVFAGLRPLVKANEAESTAALSREHQILISKNGLVSITGGKWTTYRLMGKETIDQAATLAELPYVHCQTKNLAIHGWEENATVFGSLAVYGVDAYRIEDLIGENKKLGERFHPDLPLNGAMVVWAVREEMACTLEDMLSRRTRCLLLNARATIEIAEIVAKLMAKEMGQNKKWIADQVSEFKSLAQNYLP